MDKSWWESPFCWLCDYGMFAIVFLMILLFGAYRFLFADIPEILVVDSTPTATPITALLTNTPAPTKLSLTLTPILTLTPAPEKPEFIVVFVPVNWGSTDSEFRTATQNQADIFIRESGIENYFDVKVVILENGLENASLRSDNLVIDILEIALQEQPGDRYVGLTDGDLNPDGESDVVGWTSGGYAMVAEYQEEYVVAHELGHTFGLCDEYSYADWSAQNAEYDGGCPNPYPIDCPREKNAKDLCPGEPASDGSNSIMGPAGLRGAYSFNDASYAHMQDFFKNASIGGSP